MAEFSEVEGPQCYDFEPTMSEEQYSEMMADAKAKGKHGSSPSDNEPELELERIGNTDWCECGLCETMISRVESICCSEIRKLEENVQGTCITLHRSFESLCLNEDVLSATWDLLQYSKGKQPSGNLQNRSVNLTVSPMKRILRVS